MSTLSRREEMAVSGAALSSAPWSAATVTGGVVAAGDLGLQLIGGHLGLTMLSGPVSLGVAAFFVVPGAGALVGRGTAAPWSGPAATPGGSP